MSIFLSCDSILDPVSLIVQAVKGNSGFLAGYYLLNQAQQGCSIDLSPQAAYSVYFSKVKSS